MTEDRVLGQLLVMQSIAVSLPDRQSVLSFVCRGLSDVPGVTSACHTETEPVAPADHTHRIQLHTPSRELGDLWLELDDPAAFAPYESHVTNFGLMLAVVIERLEQSRELESVVADLEAATKAKDEFLARMSHELRTPLNSVLGFSGTLLQGLAGDLTDEQRVQIEMIRRSGRHLLALVNGLLDLSKLTAGRLELSVREVVVDDVLEDVKSTIAPLAQERGIGFDVVAASGVPTLRTDRLRLKQILFNLAGNAVKFTEAGSVTLRSRNEGDTVVFEVVDTGIGISEEDQAHLFEDFYQVALGDQDIVAGVGLGLSIARELAQALGGTIDVSSTLGEGSTFRLRVPT